MAGVDNNHSVTIYEGVDWASGLFFNLFAVRTAGLPDKDIGELVRILILLAVVVSNNRFRVA